MSTSTILCLFLGALLLPGLAACSRREAPEDNYTLTTRLNEQCRQSDGENFVYRTAAGFKLAIPKWASGSLQPSQYDPDCRLNSIRLVFAWVNGELIPVRVGGMHSPPDDQKLPERHDELLVHMSFRSPQTMVTPESVKYCMDAPPRFDYPEFKLSMCADSLGGRRATQPMFGLPYAPRFEVVRDQYPPFSLSCDKQIFKGFTVENVVEASTKYSCRGYWYWRAGAAGMFDLGSGAVLKKFHLVLPAAERLMDTWLVPENR